MDNTHTETHGLLRYDDTGKDVPFRFTSIIGNVVSFATNDGTTGTIMLDAQGDAFKVVTTATRQIRCFFSNDAGRESLRELVFRSASDIRIETPRGTFALEKTATSDCGAGVWFDYWPFKIVHRDGRAWATLPCSVR